MQSKSYVVAGSGSGADSVLTVRISPYSCRVIDFLTFILSEENGNKNNDS